MADAKISELTETTSLDATDEFPLNDSGTTKKITAENLAEQLAGFSGGGATGPTGPPGTTGATGPAGSGGGGLSQSYLGYNTVGGSFESMDAGRAYTKQITMAADGLLTSIDVHVKGNSSNVGGLGVAVYEDNAGTPRKLLAVEQLHATSIYMTTTARWVSLPVGIWLTAGTYWISVASYNAVTASTQLAYDSGTDRYIDTDNTWFADWDIGYTPTTTANSYSIRASVLS